jgi:hypothetical protein
MKLPSQIESAVQALMSTRGGMGGIELLALPQLVPDRVDKAIVFTPQAQPTLVVMMAPAAYPDCVRAAFERAAAARLALGEGSTGAVVQVAICQGTFDGRSFAIVPYLTPMGRGRLRRRWDQFRLHGPVFAWLRDITRQTVVVPAQDAQAESFRTPLLSLSRLEAAGEPVCAAARGSLRALEGGQWEPRWVLAHNDLWLGNCLRRPADPASNPPFAVIDWGASQVRGHPAYDFLAFANSINLAARPLRRELRAYCAALGCEPSQFRHHLLAALGALSVALGEWPVARFAATANKLVHLADLAQ